MSKIIASMNVTLGEMVMLLRRRASIDRVDLSMKSRVPTTVISQLENDMYDGVAIKDVVAIGNALDVSFFVKPSTSKLDVIIPSLIEK